jgi:hypothetical protein
MSKILVAEDNLPNRELMQGFGDSWTPSNLKFVMDKTR